MQPTYCGMCGKLCAGPWSPRYWTADSAHRRVQTSSRYGMKRIYHGRLNSILIGVSPCSRARRALSIDLRRDTFGTRGQRQSLASPLGNPRKPPLRVVGPLFLAWVQEVIRDEEVAVIFLKEFGPKL